MIEYHCYLLQIISVQPYLDSLGFFAAEAYFNYTIFKRYVYKYPSVLSVVLYISE